MMSSSSSLSRCQDCGNQAKKECMYYRCRTCCKSKGFPCQTHVKSTWVPLYRRRQRQVFQQQRSLQHFHHQDGPITQNLASSQGLEEKLDDDDEDDDHIIEQKIKKKNNNNFPSEVNATATFHVVRVSSIADDGTAAQYAYQTSVAIGGHVFKGILYDQGPDERGTTSSYCGLVAGDQRSDHQTEPGGLMFHQLPSFVNPSATTLMMTSRSDHDQAVNYVPADQRPLFVGSSSFQPNTTANFASAGMQFFPNRE